MPALCDYDDSDGSSSNASAADYNDTDDHLPTGDATAPVCEGALFPPMPDLVLTEPQCALETNDDETSGHHEQQQQTGE